MEQVIRNLENIVLHGYGLTMEAAEDLRLRVMQWAMILMGILVGLALINIWISPFVVFCLSFVAVFAVMTNSLRPRLIALWAGLNALVAGLALNNPVRAAWESVLSSYPRIVKSALWAVVFIFIFLGTIPFEGEVKRLVYIVGLAIGIYTWVWFYEVPANWLKKVSGTYLIVGMLWHFSALGLGLVGVDIQNPDFGDDEDIHIDVSSLQPGEESATQPMNTRGGVWLTANSSLWSCPIIDEVGLPKQIGYLHNVDNRRKKLFRFEFDETVKDRLIAEGHETVLVKFLVAQNGCPS